MVAALRRGGNGAAYVDAEGDIVSQMADGTMTDDEFGNLAVSGVIRGPSGQPDLQVDYATRVVIDTVNACIHLADTESPALTDLPDVLDPALPRFYRFDEDLLRLSVRDNAGRETASVVWRKQPTGASS